MLRWIIGLPLAGLITALLFLVMARLIEPQELSGDPPDEREPIVITFEPPPPGPPPPPARPQPPEPPEPVDIQRPDKTGAPTGTFAPPPPVGPSGDGPDSGIAINIPPPDIASPPPYPQACLSKGAEGVVIVEFDVDPSGNVINPRIISSPDRCFDRPILKAIQTWKYSPNFTNGSPVMRRNVRETLRFELAEPSR